MNAIITIFNGDQAEIRPMTTADLPSDCRGEEFDARWHVVRWVRESDRLPDDGDFDCPAWVDRGHIFLPADGANRSIDFYPEGPDIGGGRNWYVAQTGKRAVSRTLAPLWPVHTGPLAEGGAR